MNWPTSLLRVLGGCVCQCHSDETEAARATPGAIDRRPGGRGVVVVRPGSAIPALTACASCRAHHTPPLPGLRLVGYRSA